MNKKSIDKLTLILIVIGLVFSARHENWLAVIYAIGFGLAMVRIIVNEYYE